MKSVDNGRQDQPLGTLTGPTEDLTTELYVCSFIPFFIGFKIPNKELTYTTPDTLGSRKLV